MERFVDLIRKKRSGYELTKEEIHSMINAYVEEKIPDYQMASMLMAIFYEGMTMKEVSELTIAMEHSGEIVDLHEIMGVKVDKHSTGGVGDKTTLIIAPIVASLGIPVAKMSGRGLGHTGGTIDKLESIPGFQTEIELKEFVRSVNEVGVCVIGQSADLAPADKKLYALRDVTATVDSIPLIASSVMSKKLAAGGDKILLDVTVGSGAFAKNMEDAMELAKTMVSIGTHAGKETVALLTNMDEPLGHAIGNNLEVKEVIEALHGNGPEDLMEVCYQLAANMIFLAGDGDIPFDLALEWSKEQIHSGKAFDKFVEMVENQGGDADYIRNPHRFEQAKVVKPILAKESGYIKSMDTTGIGTTSSILGAGRATKESAIDYSAGIILSKKTGDYANRNDVIGYVHTSSEELADKGLDYFKNCYEMSSRSPIPISLIKGRITRLDIK